MPINITRLSLEAIGAQLGTVVPRTPTSSYTPFIRNNWVDTVTIDTTWMTVLASAEATGAEQRIQRRKRPVRTISARCTAMTQEDSVDMQMVIQEMQKKSSTAFPLYCDRSELTKNYNNDDTELYCDTRQRRFYKGQKILLVKGDYSRFQATSSVKAAGAYLFIEEVRSDSLVVAPLSYHFPAGSHVFPVIDVHPDLKMKTELLTDRYSIVKMKALEIEGKSCLPSSWAGATPPPGNLYEGHPIMEIRPNYATKVEQSFLRKGSRFKSGKGSHTALHADAPQIAFKYTDSNFSREEAWDLLRFFDSRQGRTKPFWVMQPLTFWEPLAITKTYIDVPDHNYIANMINLVKHIGIKDSSGTIHIKAVDEIINHPGQLFKDPEDFIDSTWSFSGDAEGVANTHLAPDGELTADSITANADDTVANVMQDVAITPTGDAPYTFSVHVKDRDPLLGPADNVQIIVYLLGPPTPPAVTREYMSFNVDLASGSITYFSQDTKGGSDYTLDDITVESVGGYWRLSCTLIDYSGESDRCRMRIYPNPQNVSVERTVVVWGAQLVNAPGPAPPYDKKIGEYRIDFSSDPFTVTPTGVKDVSPAWLCRFGSDTLKQTWTTDTISNSQISIVQVLNEKTTGLSNM